MYSDYVLKNPFYEIEQVGSGDVCPCVHCGVHRTGLLFLSSCEKCRSMEFNQMINASLYCKIVLVCVDLSIAVAELHCKLSEL